MLCSWSVINYLFSASLTLHCKLLDGWGWNFTDELQALDLEQKRVLEMAKLSAENLGELHSYIQREEKSLIEGFSCIGVNFRPIASGGIALHKRELISCSGKLHFDTLRALLFHRLLFCVFFWEKLVLCHDQRDISRRVHKIECKLSWWTCWNWKCKHDVEKDTTVVSFAKKKKNHQFGFGEKFCI